MTTPWTTDRKNGEGKEEKESEVLMIVVKGTWVAVRVGFQQIIVKYTACVDMVVP